MFLGAHGEEDAENESAVDVPQHEDAGEDQPADSEPGAENIMRGQRADKLTVIPVNPTVGSTIAITICQRGITPKPLFKCKPDDESHSCFGPQ